MYLLDFWEQNLSEQVSEFFGSIRNIVVDTGLTIYENMVSIMGDVPAKMTIMVVVCFVVIYFLLKIINR